MASIFGMVEATVASFMIKFMGVLTIIMLAVARKLLPQHNMVVTKFSVYDLS